MHLKMSPVTFRPFCPDRKVCLPAIKKTMGANYLNNYAGICKYIDEAYQYFR